MSKRTPEQLFWQWEELKNYLKTMSGRVIERGSSRTSGRMFGFCCAALLDKMHELETKTVDVSNMFMNATKLKPLEEGDG